jgi:hypothetical protein
MTRPVLEALLVMVVLGVIAGVSVWLQQPFLAPSLGSAAFIQVMSPDDKSARVWDTAAGQLVAVVAGFVGVYVASAASDPPFLTQHDLVWTRVVAMVIATGLTVIGQRLLKVNSPAGGATAVVLAIGLEAPNWLGAGRLIVAIVLVTALGEMARLIVLWRR